MTFCVQCGASVPQGAMQCVSCGRALSGTTAPPPAYAPAAPPAPAYQAYAPVPPLPPPYAPQQETRVVSEGMGIAALLLNIFIWPGLGTIVAGARIGWVQGFLMLGGVILTITIIGAIVGIPMIIGAWIWAIVSGVRLMQGKAA